MPKLLLPQKNPGIVTAEVVVCNFKPGKSSELNFHNLFFFLNKEIIYQLDEAISSFLNVIKPFLLFVLSDELVFFLFFQFFITVTSDIPDGNFTVFTDFFTIFEDILASLLGKWRNRQSNQIAIVLRIETKVDGIYDSDPATNPSAVRFASISHAEALSRQLKVMDATAFSFCQENDIPIIIFKLMERGNLRKSLEGTSVGSIIKTGGQG